MTNTTTSMEIFKKAMSEYIGNNLENSVNLLSEAIEKDPNFKLAYASRGSAHLRFDDLKEAIEDFDRAIELDPDYGAAYFSRATLLTKMGQEDFAVDDMQMVAHLTNRHIEEFANENNVWRSQFLKLEATEVANTMER